MQQATTINDLTDDARFQVIKNLDYDSINHLCNSNRIFRQFCNAFEGDIYKYLLHRDYGIDSPRDIAKNGYLQARIVQNLTLKRLREMGLTIFADMLELECLVNPTGPIHQLFAFPTEQVIIVPTDAAIQEYIKSVIYYEDDDFYEKFGTLFLKNHVGIITRDPFTVKFTNLNRLIFTISIPEHPLIDIGNIMGLRLYSRNQVIISGEQHNMIFNYFDVPGPY